MLLPTSCPGHLAKHRKRMSADLYGRLNSGIKAKKQTNNNNNNNKTNKKTKQNSNNGIEVSLSALYAAVYSNSIRCAKFTVTDFFSSYSTFSKGCRLIRNLPVVVSSVLNIPTLSRYEILHVKCMADFFSFTQCMCVRLCLK